MVKYQTIAGQSFPVGSIGRDDLRFRIQNTTEDECREYAELLKRSGYQKLVEREISAGSEFPYNTNLFYTYINNEKQVFVFWDASIHTSFITVEPLGALPSATPFFPTKKSCDLIFTQLQVHGMCYIIRLTNGTFVIVDGGENREEDVDRLYNFLKENSLTDTPTVALWILTHPHKDHIGGASRFIEKYKNEVFIQAFAYQFPNCDKISVSMENVADMKNEIEAFKKNVATYYPKATQYTLHTGQSYFFSDVEIEILWSMDDTYPSFYTSFNDMSAALRFKFANGKKIFLLADCMHEANARIARRYGDYLKSDIMQVAHHGLIGGDKNLYKIVEPQICFWPTSKSVFLGEKFNQRYQWSLGEGGCDYNAYLRDKTICERVHYHAGETITIKLEVLKR